VRAPTVIGRSLEDNGRPRLDPFAGARHTCFVRARDQHERPQSIRCLAANGVS